MNAKANGSTEKGWEPKIIALVCNWCTYAGADLAGTSRIRYTPNVRVIKLPCTGRIDPLFIVRAFARGADGVLVSGCHPGDCHYIAGNYHARRRWTVFRELLNFVGIDSERVTFAWVSAAEGKKWADLVNEVTENIRRLGPFTRYTSLVSSGTMRSPASR
jgi:coenzyme F420-reducing hydrogenase delta subunit